MSIGESWSLWRCFPVTLGTSMMLDVVLRCSGKSYIIALFRVFGLVLGIPVIFCVVAWSPTLVEAEPAEAICTQHCWFWHGWIIAWEDGREGPPWLAYMGAHLKALPTPGSYWAKITYLCVGQRKGFVNTHGSSPIFHTKLLLLDPSQFVTNTPTL